MPDVAASHTVFVSHAHADNELCDRYVAALRARGLDVWYDRTNMQDGHFLSDQISEELERRTAFVVLLTPTSLESYYVKLETDAYRVLVARERTRLFLPVRVAECKVPILMTGIKYIDAMSLGFHAAIDALAKALQAHGASDASYTSDTTDAIPSASRQYPSAAPQQPGSFSQLSIEAVAPSSDVSVHSDADFALNAGGMEPKAQLSQSVERTASAYTLPQLLSTPLKPLSYADTSNTSTREPSSPATSNLPAASEASAPDSAPAAIAVSQTRRGINPPWVVKYTNALVAHERVLALSPRDVEAWTGKGDALRMLNRYNEALAAYEQSLALDPSHAKAWVGKVEALRAMYRHYEADAANRRLLKVCDKALKRNPRDVTTWMNLGHALITSGRAAEALEAFKRARALDPSQSNVVFEIAMARQYLEHQRKKR